MTEAEGLLWYHLREWPVKFRRQEPLGTYICDFVCYPRRLIVEVDGGQHLESHSDRVRDEWLRGQGFTVLRVWNGDVFTNIEEVLDAVWAALDMSET